MMPLAVSFRLPVTLTQISPNAATYSPVLDRRPYPCWLITVMLKGSALTAKHNIHLHLPHALLILLTVLFLILGGVTGPLAGFWWLSITYDPGRKWNVGGLGACIDGTKWV